MRISCSSVRLLWTVLLTALFASVSQAQFTVSGRQILKGGTPFTVKGICYNPTPIGDNGFTRAPNGDYFTSKYASIQDRDLPLLRQMGANTVRVYGWAPTADHSGFLNKCYNNGTQPIYVLVNYWIDPATDWNNTRSVQTLIDQYTSIESRLGSNPAVLGIILGNECNQYYGNGDKPAFWAAMNKIALAIKAKNPSRLVSIAITDAINHVSNGDATLTGIDFWCMQIYRYPSWGSLFSDFAWRSSRPLVISEFGFDALNNSQNTPWPDNGALPAQALSGYWQEISANSAVCSGGCVFEWSDEWFKVRSGGDTTHDAGGFYTQFPDGVADEEWWGINAVSKTSSGLDALSPRQAYYTLSALWNTTVVNPPPPPPPSTSLDLSFETVSLGTTGWNAYKYNPSLSNYAFNGNSGVAGNSSGFTASNPGAPDGSQVAFVQMQGSISLTLPLTSGTYKVSAQVANRANWGGAQSVLVYMDGQLIGSFAGGTSYSTVSTNSFTVADGTHTISFNGQASADATLLIDRISVQAASAGVSVSIGNAGFESPGIGSGAYWNYQYGPATTSGSQDWVFSGSSGVSGNGSGFTVSNTNAPEGTQIAFLQTADSSISQSISFPASTTYTLSVKAAQRANWNQAQQLVQVLVDGSVVGTISPSSTQYQSFSIPFNVSQGSHQLTFKGTVAADCTVFLDQLSIQGN